MRGSWATMPAHEASAERLRCPFNPVATVISAHAIARGADVPYARLTLELSQHRLSRLRGASPPPRWRPVDGVTFREGKPLCRGGHHRDGPAAGWRDGDGGHVSVGQSADDPWSASTTSKSAPRFVANGAFVTRHARASRTRRCLRRAHGAASR